MDSKATSAIQSVDRVFQIMELLSEYPKGLALMDICAQTGLPKATVSRMLCALSDNGYAVQDTENRKYRLTRRLFEIGSRVADSANILTAARPFLDQLARQTGEAVHLVSRVKDEVVYLYKEEGASIGVRMGSYVGLHNPMYCTGVGKSILAFLPDEEITAIWNRSEITQFTENTITTIEKLYEEINKIRSLGYALDMEEHEPGVRCIAAPILDLKRNPIAAISLSAPSIRMSADRIDALVPLVLQTAAQISRSY